MTSCWTTMDSPIGSLLLSGDGTALTGVHMQPHPSRPGERDDAALAEPVRQLTEYFAGRRTTFDLVLRPSGTDFQRRVWELLRAIPYGQTASYGELAAALGQPTASRAVGTANGRNPIAVVVPCHRVIGSDGGLVGFGGGLPRKRWLLGHEGVRVPASAASATAAAGLW